MGYVYAIIWGVVVGFAVHFVIRREIKRGNVSFHWKAIVSAVAGVITGTVISHFIWGLTAYLVFGYMFMPLVIFMVLILMTPAP